MKYLIERDTTEDITVEADSATEAIAKALTINAQFWTIQDVEHDYRIYRGDESFTTDEFWQFPE